MPEINFETVLIILLAVSEALGLQTKFGPGSLIGVALTIIRMLAGRKKP